MNSYDDATKRTEPHCCKYLAKKGFIVEHQSSKTDSPFLLKHKNKQYKLPDLKVYQDGICIFIECKAYDEFTPIEIYKLYGKIGHPDLKPLIEEKRFQYLQKHDYSQGIDKKELKRLKDLLLLTRIPLVITFNDHKLLGTWYGCTYNDFAKLSKLKNYGKEQYFIKIKHLKPLDRIINNILDSYIFSMKKSINQIGVDIL